MSVKVASLYADLGVKDSLTPALQNAKGGLSGFGGALTAGIGKLVGITSAMGVAVAAAKGFRMALDAAAESETGFVRLEATLRATGREAEISAGAIGRMAEALMGVSTFDDEAIVNAYNALAKFNSVPTSGMEAIVKAAMDMTAALGGDLASNAESIGKLLESGLIPRTWGFSEALKATIKAEIDAGDSAGALSIVMKELNNRFGGQAAAQLDTYNGSVLHLKTSMGEFWEAVGQGLVGPGKDFNTWLDTNIDKATKSINVFNDRTVAVDIMNKYLVAVGREEEKYSDAIAAQIQLMLNWMDTGRIWQNWMDGQPEKIDAVTEAMQAQVNVMFDYGEKLSSLSGYAMDYDQSVADMTIAQKDLTDAQNFYNRAVSDTNNLEWLKGGVTRATENLDLLKAGEFDLTAAQEELTLAQKLYDDALGDSVGLSGAKTKLDEATLAVETLEAAQQLQTDMWVLNCLTQQLSVDGLTEAEMAYLLQYQVDTGIITEEAKQRAQEQWNYVAALQAGVGDWISNVYRTEYNRTLPWGATGGPGGAGLQGQIPAIPQATGGDWIVDKPTVFLAGEAGKERATFTPLGSGGGKGGLGKSFVFNDDAQLIIQVPQGQQFEDAMDYFMDKMR